AHLLPAVLDELPDVGGGGGAVVHDEISVCRRYSRAANRGAFEAGAIDERAGGWRYAFGDVFTGRIGILKDAAGARRVERLRALAERERFSRCRAHRRRIAAANAEDGRQQHFARTLQAAAIVAESHRLDGNVYRQAIKTDEARFGQMIAN